MESPYYKSKNQEEMQRSILPFETTDQRKGVLSSQSLWGPSVESTYPFRRVLHLILSSHTVNTEILLCAIDPGKTRCISLSPCSQRLYILGSIFYLCRYTGRRMACLPGC